MIDKKNTVVIFFPFQLENLNRTYLYGEFESFNEFVTLFFTTIIFDASKNNVLNLCSTKNVNCEQTKQINWIYLEVNENVLSLKEIKIQGTFRDIRQCQILWINYNFKEFSKFEILSSDTYSTYNNESYFRFLKKKINGKICCENKSKSSFFKLIKNTIFRTLIFIISNLSYYSVMFMPVTKYFQVAVHLNSYLDGFIWVIRSSNKKKELNIKAMNYLLSVALDMVLGIMLLQWLNSKISLDSSSTLFMLTAESIVNSIKDLINWLRGDPAGLKLNWAFNKVLAKFFSFHIDIWWAFIVYLKPVVKIIFQIFLKLGLLGITFQTSIIADLLALVSFHVYCIYAYAAKLYSIQISSLISLWRLFLGRKKNPLRNKVDSCRYTPEQLFVGTLGFTILLFLLPTTLLYYVVFTCIRLLLVMLGAILKLIRYFILTLPVYSSLLWIIKSPKVSAEIEITTYCTNLKSDFIILKVKPVTSSWWETVKFFIPDCVAKPSDFRFTDFVSSFMSGKLIYPHEIY